MMRAWLFFLGFSLQRQARARLLVLVSLGLLILVAILVHLNTRFDRWNMAHWRMSVRLPQKHAEPWQILIGAVARQPQPDVVRLPLSEIQAAVELPTHLAFNPEGTTGVAAIAAALRAAIYDAAPPRIFTGSIIVALLASFLMPLWTLTFATESLGRARETRTLTWLLLRPVPRSGLYLAGYLAALPWTLALNLGGYLVFCLLGGKPGTIALPLFWLPILLGTLAFTALFQFLSVTFRRAGIVGLLYAFFFETIASNLPGQQKRLSISYYVRCLMLDRAQDASITLDIAGAKPPVSGETAMVVLSVATLILVAIGMSVFASKEYVETGET